MNQILNFYFEVDLLINLIFLQLLFQLKQSAIISAAYITFLGFLSDQVRVKTLAVWLETFRLSNFDFLKFMSDDKEQVGYLV